MSGASPMPPERVPTLTEVVAWPQSERQPQPAVGVPDASIYGGGSASVPAPEQSGAVLPPSSPAAAAPPRAEADLLPFTMPPLRGGEAQMLQNVLVEVQRQVDLMLEVRLREVLTPLLNRAADSIVRDARAELASTLRDVVARAVTEELSRHRTR